MSNLVVLDRKKFKVDGFSDVMSATEKLFKGAQDSVARSMMLLLLGQACNTYLQSLPISKNGVNYPLPKGDELCVFASSGELANGGRRTATVGTEGGSKDICVVTWEAGGQRWDADEGDYIIKSMRDGCYACKREEFLKKYEILKKE